MNNEYRNDYDGTPMLVLNYDGSMSADISVDNKDIWIFSCIYDDCSGISIPKED